MFIYWNSFERFKRNSLIHYIIVFMYLFMYSRNNIHRTTSRSFLLFLTRIIFIGWGIMSNRLDTYLPPNIWLVGLQCSVHPGVCLRLLLLEIRTAELIEASNYRAWTRRWRTRGHRGRCQPGLGSVILQPPWGQLLHSPTWSSNWWMNKPALLLSQSIRRTMPWASPYRPPSYS